MLYKIYDFINKEIKLNYKSRPEAAEKMGISKELLNSFLNNLKTGKGITVKSLYKMLDGLGYEVCFKKKDNKKED